MSEAEHLIENIILAMVRDEDVDKELELPHNQEMLRHVGISPGDLYAMAWHVTHVLYKGVSPDRQIEAENFYEEMALLLNKEKDAQSRHIRADNLMCDVLRENGFEDGVAVFNMMEKWYA